jgi:hypothetical protein
MPAALTASTMLATAIALLPAAGHAAPPALVEIGSLLRELQAMTADHARQGDAQPPAMAELAALLRDMRMLMHRTERRADEPFASIPPLDVSIIDAAMMGESQCSSAAVVYLSTGSTLIQGGGGTTTLVFETPTMTQELSFASGTAQASIIAAIDAIGLSTIVVYFGWRVAVTTGERGSDEFLSVTQTAGPLPILYDTIGSQPPPSPQFAVIDFGTDDMLGDLDCDMVVDLIDLNILLFQWGPASGFADFNGDGTVNGYDLAILLAQWTFD